MKYLFKEWSEWKKKLTDNFLLLYIDFDGTLVPIEKDPSKVQLSLRTKNILRRLALASHVELAIVSGRSHSDIQNKVRIKEIVYVGNHGIELKGPKIKFESTLPQDYRKILTRLKKELEEKLSAIHGVLIEDKGLSLSIHYRRVPKKHMADVKTIVHETTIVESIKDKIRKHSGKMVIEIRPPIPWDKGKIILWLLARQKVLLKHDEILPVYIGDDQTDEDAFKMIRPRGLSIFVGSPHKKSLAQYYLKNPLDVRTFLKRVLDIQDTRKENIIEEISACINSQ